MSIQALFITLNAQKVKSNIDVTNDLFGRHDINTVIIPGVVIDSYDEVVHRLSPYARHVRKHGRSTHEHLSTLSEVGCFMAHMNAWKYSIDNNLDVFVIEDGVYGYNIPEVDKMIKCIKTYQSTDQPIHYVSFHNLYLHNVCEDTSASSLPIDNFKSLTVPRFSGKCYYMTHELAKFLITQVNKKGIEFQVDWFIEQEIIYSDNIGIRKGSYTVKDSNNLISVRSSTTCKHDEIRRQRLRPIHIHRMYVFTNVLIIAIVMTMIIIYISKNM